MIDIILSVILIIMNFAYLWFAESTRRKNEYNNIKNVFYRCIFSLVLTILFLIQAIMSGEIYHNTFFSIMMWICVLIWIESLIIHIIVLKKRIISISFIVVEKESLEDDKTDNNE